MRSATPATPSSKAAVSPSSAATSRPRSHNRCAGSAESIVPSPDVRRLTSWIPSPPRFSSSSAIPRPNPDIVDARRSATKSRSIRAGKVGTRSSSARSAGGGDLGQRRDPRDRVAHHIVDVADIGIAERAHEPAQDPRRGDEAPITVLANVRGRPVRSVQLRVDRVGCQTRRPGTRQPADRQVEVQVATEHTGERRGTVLEIARDDEAELQEQRRLGGDRGVGEQRTGQRCDDVREDLAGIATRVDREAHARLVVDDPDPVARVHGRGDCTSALIEA